jgi:hypothetical protein
MGKPSEMTAVTACAASIDFDSALAVLSALAKPLAPVAVSLSDAGGCHLAAPIHARLDSPRHACAAMDGYAVRDRDLSTGAETFRSIGVSYAGSGAAGEIGPGETMRVMTGAPVPRGADRVVMIEYCRQSEGGVRIEHPPLGKPHIRLPGSDFALGQLLIPKDTKVTPAVVISAAAADHYELLVSPRPRVQLLATGDEIVAPGSAAGGAFVIPDSLTTAIELLCHSAGATGGREGRSGISWESKNMPRRICPARPGNRFRRRYHETWQAGLVRKSRSAACSWTPRKSRCGPHDRPPVPFTSHHLSSGRRRYRRPALAAAPGARTHRSQWAARGFPVRGDILHRR